LEQAQRHLAVRPRVGEPAQQAVDLAEAAVGVGLCGGIAESFRGRQARLLR
jgi:hypothetical protein